jgi:NAD(P) transhydrogenase subunit alpha
MRIGVPRETFAGECRVATTPDVAELLQKLGYSVAVESDAGALANYSNEAYEAAGCEIVDTASVWSDSDIILKVRAPEGEEATGLRLSSASCSRARTPNYWSN